MVGGCELLGNLITGYCPRCLWHIWENHKNWSNRNNGDGERSMPVCLYEEHTLQTMVFNGDQSTIPFSERAVDLIRFTTFTPHFIYSINFEIVQNFTTLFKTYEK